MYGNDHTREYHINHFHNIPFEGQKITPFKEKEATIIDSALPKPVHFQSHRPTKNHLIVSSSRILKENLASSKYEHISSLLKDKPQSMINKLLYLYLHKCSILVRIYTK